MISVKARWERWCMWNCDLRVINAHKKGIFCRTESIAMTPKSRDHMPTTSLWGVTAKWPTRAPKTNWYFARETHKDTAISLQFEPVGHDFERVPEHRVSFDMQYSMGFAKSHSLKCSLHKWAWCSAASKSARLNCINLIHFRLTAGRLRGSSCIVIAGVVCELLQFMATQCPVLLTTHIRSLLKNLRWQPHWLRRLTSLPGNPTENKNPIKQFYIYFFH